MAKVYVRPEEGLEKALKRFSNYVAKDGIVEDYKRQLAFRPKNRKKKR